MSHLPTLIADLALILISASIITLLFKWLKQPLVLGYIIAGITKIPMRNHRIKKKTTLSTLISKSSPTKS